MLDGWMDGWMQRCLFFGGALAGMLPSHRYPISKSLIGPPLRLADGIPDGRMEHPAHPDGSSHPNPKRKLISVPD